ncbi:hypothetical protein HU675_0010665 [Bradyrhizobium septentrionale]|uniref:hypothetical protein n=1 Tax=Bradyrhizobium septentrionale TaxID=1404411 RepID=UPI001596C1C7|nr:hypothetical protein [Bradyrhizobium septentrionale]UGY27172.1 hypothetical protein HU675_0010665 [Bradyrhizobium septentrionale]
MTIDFREWMLLNAAFKHAWEQLGNSKLAHLAIRHHLSAAEIDSMISILKLINDVGEVVSVSRDAPPPTQFWNDRVGINWETDLVLGEGWQAPGSTYYRAAGVMLKRSDVFRLWPKASAAPEGARRSASPDGFAVTSSERRPGRPSKKFDEIKAQMSKMDAAELDGMLEKEMSAKFNAARSTCEKARKAVQLARVEN